MNPPVEAPTSTATRPAGSTPKRVERALQLQRAAADVLGPGQHLDRAPRRAPAVPGLVRGRAVHAHAARHDQRLRLLARLGQAALDEPDVEARARRRLTRAAPRSGAARPPAAAPRSPERRERLAAPRPAARAAMRARAARGRGRARRWPCSAAASLPAVLPSCSAPSVASSTSSTTWKARPMADA